MLRILLILLIFLSAINVHAARVSGVISDSLGNPIPYVRVIVEHENIGVLSNLNGQYYLELAPGKHTLIFNNIEYSGKRIEIELGKTEMKLDVVMQVKVQDLEQLKISADREDPAYPIIRQAIENRKKYLKQHTTYKFDTYTKCAIEREDKVPDSISSGDNYTKKHHNFIESFSTTYFEAPSNSKQIVHAYTDHTAKKNSVVVSYSYGDSDEGPPIGSEHKPGLYRQNTIDPGFNFYENRIEHPALSSNPLISPIANAALITYKYKLEDIWMDEKNKRMMYKIKVWPKRQVSSTFEGHIYIEDSSFALTGVDLDINPKILQKFKKFTINQTYKEDDGFRVLEREEYFYLDKEFKTKVFGNTLMIHSNHAYDFEIDKRFFRNEVKVVEDTACDQDSSYWNNLRPITLREEEAKFVHIQDSIIAFQKTEEYTKQQDSIFNRKGILNFLFTGVGFRNTFKGQELYFSPILQQIRPFGVGGYRHALPFYYKKELKRGYDIRTRVSLDYGFNNKDLKGSLDLRFTYLPKKFGKLHFKIGDEYRMLNPFNSIAATFSRSNYINTKGITIGHNIEIVNGLYLDVDFEYGKNYSIADVELSQWSEQLFGTLNTPVDFDPFSEFYIDAHLTYSIKQKYYSAPYKKIIIGTDYPKFTLWYKKGVKGLFNSVVDFDLLELHVRDEFQVASLGESKWDLHVGSFLRNNNVMLTDYKFFRGSDRYFFSNPLLSFQLLGPTISTIKSYFQANYIHHFNGAIMNKIPLINRLGLQATVGGGILMVDEDSFKHIELYAGLEKPFRLFKETVKMGVYFVTADSNHSDLDATFKIGINFFNAFTNKWEY